MSSGALVRVTGLQELLDRCQRLIRVHSVLRGLAETLCVLIACLLFGCLLDYVIALPSAVRLALLGLTAVLLVAVTWKRLIAPLLQHAPADELGAAVDLRFPELHESLATLISVEDDRATSGEAGSALMRQRLEQHVQSQIYSIRPTEVVRSETTWKRCGLALSSVIAFLIPLLLWPSGSQLLLQRFVMPLANLAAPTNLFFEVPDGNRTVATNTDVEFIAIPRWRTDAAGEIPTDVVLEMHGTTGESEDLAMRFDEAEAQFTVTLANVRQSLRYRIRGGRAVTEWFELTVADPPRILSAVLVETPPVYTGRPVETYDGIVGDIPVFERSTIEIALQFNKPVNDVSLEWLDWKPIEKLAADSAPAETEVLPQEGTLTVDGMAATFRFEALGSGRFEFHVADALGLTNLNETTRRLIVTTDTPPQLTVSGVSDGLEVRPDDIVPLNCRVIDDIGVGELELHFQKNADATRIETALPFDRGAQTVSHEFRLDLKALDVKAGDTVTLKVRTADERPVPGPQVATKGPWTIRIADNAEPLGQKPLREADQQLVDALRKLEEQLQLDANKGNELKDKLWQQWNAETQESVRELSEKEQTQGRELQQLAEQAAQHPLMKKQADKLTDLAQDIRQDVPEKLDAAAAAEKDQAHRNIQESVNDLNRIREELHKTTDEIQRAAQLEQELAELNRLALDAQQLARDSEDLQKRRQDNQPEEGQTKEDLQQKLDQQQQQLQQEQQKLTNDLGNLLQRKQELLQAAREAQLDDVAEVAEQALRLAQQQQQLAEGINEESRDAARDAQELANQLQQARNEADQLGQKIQQHAHDVQRPEMQPLDEAIRDLRQGNLNSPQQGIDKAQEQLANAAEKLHKPVEAPPVDPNVQPDERALEEAGKKLAEQNAKRHELGNKAGEINDRLEQLKGQLAEMAKQLGAKPAEENPRRMAPSGPSSSSDPSNSAPSSVPEGAEGRSDQESEDPAKGDAGEAGRKLLDQLAQMTDAAHEQADALKADAAAHNGAKHHSEQSAQRADEALRHAMAGQFSRAAERMRNTASESSQAADHLNQESEQDRRQQLQQQRDDFNRMSDTFQQLQQDDAAQVAAQQDSQQGVAEAAEALPQPLEELAERLNIPQLGLQHLARPAEEAAAAAREGAQSGDRASEQLDETQLQQAGQTAQEAAGQLNRAAQLAQQASQGHRDPNAIVPTEVGDSVNDALHSLQQASEMMNQEAAERSAAQQAAQQAAAAEQAAREPGQQQGQQPGEGQSGEAGQPGQQPGDQPGQQPGADDQPGQGPPGKGQQAGKEGQPGQGQPGRGQQSGQGQPGQGDSAARNSSARQLAKAAKSLQKAAQGTLPNQFSPGQLNSDSAGAATDSKGDGNIAEFDGQIPNATRRKGQRRLWGQLQDELDNDVSDAAKEVLDSEYSELIRRYRRDLARSGNQDSDGKADTKP